MLTCKTKITKITLCDVLNFLPRLCEVRHGNPQLPSCRQKERLSSHKVDVHALTVRIIPKSHVSHHDC